MTGLDDGLGLAKDGEMAIEGVANSELLGYGDDVDVLTVADEYA